MTLSQRDAIRAGILAALSLTMLYPSAATGEEASPREALGRRLEPYVEPPQEFVGKLGDYRSPLKFAEGGQVKSADDWAKRRKEILELWHRRLGAWPPLVERP